MQKEKLKKKYKLLSFQPFPIFGNGGGARILRRLVENEEENVLFFSIGDGWKKEKFTNKYYNVFLQNIYPLHRNWHRSFIREFINFFRYKVLHSFNSYLIRRAINEYDFDILHIVDHGHYSNSLTDYALKNRKEIWVSFHDHPQFMHKENICNTDFLWKNSHRRMVISKEMGCNYCEIFGDMEYDIITDGLLSDEISSPHIFTHKKVYEIYFSGLLHISYYPLFKVLHFSLKSVSEDLGIKFKFILRGTQKLNFLSSSNNIDYEYRPFCLDDKILKKEMDNADILYLPIMFDNEFFYKYSLSTKMIGYLGASGNILYHGPSDSAACNLLKENNAAFCCVSLLKEDMIYQIKQMLLLDRNVSGNAKILTKSNFDLNNIQNIFWKH